MERQRRSVQPRRSPVLVPVPVPVPVLMAVMARPQRRQLHADLVSSRRVDHLQQLYVLMTAAPPAAVTAVVLPLPMVIIVMWQGVGGL